jgi:hypothetical protein
MMLLESVVGQWVTALLYINESEVEEKTASSCIMFTEK